MIIAVLTLVMLAGCAHKPLPPVVTTVYVKVKEPCIKKERVPVKPTYKFGKGDEPDDKQKAVLLTEDFESAEQYGSEWEAAATGCISSPSQ
jgi:hypothetical protein